MTYARIENNAVVEHPLWQGDIEAIHSTTFPENWEGGEIDGKTYVKLKEGVLHSPTQYQTVEYGEPILVDGEWTENYILVDMSQEQIAAMDVAYEKYSQAREALVNLGIESPELDKILRATKPVRSANNQPITTGLQDI